MNALAVTIAAFAFTLITGIATTVALRRALDVPDVLLASALGWAILAPLVMLLNRLGLPVDRFALPLTILLTALSVVILLLTRREISQALRGAAPFVIVAVVALFLTGRPMLQFGNNWLSYSNDDALNYALSAERMRIDPYFAPPVRAMYVANKDIRRDYYFLTDVANERYGVDELLAFVSAVSRMDAIRAIMPLLVALHLSGLFAAAALVYRGSNGRAIALLCSIGLTFSALATFGVDYQLLGQVAGVALLTASVARMCDPSISEVRGREFVSRTILALLLFAGLCACYPELTPFALIVAVAYHFARRPHQARRRAVFLVNIALGTIVVLNAYVRNYTWVLLSRTGISHSATAPPAGLIDLWPYYKVPSGLPNFFGIVGIATFPAEPWMSLSIAIAIILFVVTIALCIKSAKRQEPAGYLALLFITFCILFFISKTGFALYKIAMYVQPAIWAVLASTLFRIGVRVNRLRRLALIICSIALLGSNAITQQYYVERSCASPTAKTANFVEIPDGSGSRLLDRLSYLRARLTPSDVVVSDTFNIVLGKLESFYLRGSAALYPSTDMFRVGVYNGGDPKLRFLTDVQMDRVAKGLADQRYLHFHHAQFPVDTLDGKHLVDDFLVDDRLSANVSLFWLSGPEQAPFNRLTVSVGPSVGSVRPSRVKNILSFVNGSLGRSYFEHVEPVGIYQLEPDYFSSRSSMDGVGRYLLFEVLQPSAPIRVRVSFTETLNGDGKSWLPPVSVIGTTRGWVRVTGRGSASAISQPVYPRLIDGRSYILLDMGVEPHRFKSRKTGLMSLWGRDVDLDPRLLTAFLRDLSSFGPGAAPDPPSAIQHLPDDLLTPAADYSGIYEDGWASERFLTRLKVEKPGDVRLRGFVPLIDSKDFSTDLTVTVDGHFAMFTHLPVGSFDLNIPAEPGIREIEYHFSQFQRLPGGDHRPVAIKLLSVGPPGQTTAAKSRFPNPDGISVAVEGLWASPAPVAER